MKKNGFLTFMFSIIPGCGLMYLGYMKKGLQIMAMFAASCYLASIFLFSGYGYYYEWIYTFFLFLLPVIWFYQMFDCMHSLSQMKRYEWEVPPDDGFFMPFIRLKPNKFPPAHNPALMKIIAVILIFGGGYGLFFRTLDYIYTTIKSPVIKNIITALREYSIPALVSLALIILGIKFLAGSRSNTSADVMYDENDDDLN